VYGTILQGREADGVSRRVSSAMSTSPWPLTGRGAVSRSWESRSINASFPCHATAADQEIASPSSLRRTANDPLTRKQQLPRGTSSHPRILRVGAFVATARSGENAACWALEGGSHSPVTPPPRIKRSRPRHLFAGRPMTPVPASRSYHVDPPTPFDSQSGGGRGDRGRYVGRISLS
jgi:hypothetical protein